jgi:hypothetical protein
MGQKVTVAHLSSTEHISVELSKWKLCGKFGGNGTWIATEYALVLLVDCFAYYAPPERFQQEYHNQES